MDPMDFRSIRIASIAGSSTLNLSAASQLVAKYSWGEDYPVVPFEEINHADFCVGAWKRKTLVGFAAVTRNGSPDGNGNGELWLGYAVVVPELRRRGIFRRLYAACVTRLQTFPGRVFSCTDNPIIAAFLLRHGWQFERETHDESGESCLVFEYPRVSQVN